jgi:hypothetical protein
MKAINPLIGHIRGRMTNRNLNWLCVITGMPGTGKSYSALRLAEVIDPKFQLYQCVWTADQFFDLLNNKKLRKGSVIIWDEAGVGMPAREWYSLSNKAINYVVQTFRYRNLGLIMTTPSMSFVDSQIRKLFHAHIKTLRVDRKKEQVVAKYYWLMHKKSKYKDYYTFFERIRGPDGNKSAVEEIWINKPSKDIVDAYEKQKDEYCSELNKDLESELKAKRYNEIKKKMTDDDLARKVIKEGQELCKTDGEWATMKIGAFLRASTPKASRIKEIIKMNSKLKSKENVIF